MLRKFVVITAALGLGLGIASSASAQSIMVGAEAGLNVSNVSVDNDMVFGVNPESKSGFWGGIFAEFGLTPIFALRPEAQFSSEGFKVSEAGAELKLNVNYIKIPVLFEAVIPVEGSPIRPVLFAGPAIQFETKCSFSGSADGISASTDCDDPDLEFERAKTIWSIVFGGEVGYETGKVLPFVGVRYGIGLTNLDNTDDPDSIKGKVWTFYGGVGLPVK